MKIFTSKQLRELDAYTIKSESTTSRVLMQRASLAMSKVILQRFSLDRRVIVFAGPGNNGGDALATARLLIDRGYKPVVYLFNTLVKPSVHARTVQLQLCFA